jgi:hypothetical protein
LQRCFEQVAKQMPKIDGFELKVCLEHPDDILRLKIDTLEVGSLPIARLLIRISMDRARRSATTVFG